MYVFLLETFGLFFFLFKIRHVMSLVFDTWLLAFYAASSQAQSTVIRCGHKEHTRKKHDFPLLLQFT